MAKRINISVPKPLWHMIQENPELNISRVCQRAILDALSKHWAEKEQMKLEAGLTE